MSTIQFEDGTQVQFDGTPTSQDVDEVANQLGLQKKTPVKMGEKPQRSKMDVASKILDVVFGGGKIGEAIGTQIAKARATPEEKKFVSPGPSSREIAGDILKIGATAATPFIPGASTLRGAIGVGAAVGATSGLAEGLRKEEAFPETIKSTALGGAVGSVSGGLAFGAQKLLQRGIPKLLSYTSDTPEGVLMRASERPQLTKQALQTLKKEGEDEFLKRTQQGVRDLRGSLTRDYKDSVEKLSVHFSDKRAGFSIDETKLLNKLSDDFGIDIPQNLKSLSVKESLELYANINELFSKKAVRESAQGVIVRKGRDLVRSKILTNFGGKEGAVAQMLKNYSTESDVLFASNKLLKAYQQKDPVAQSSALSNIKGLYKENKNAYLSAIQRLEEKTGIPILDEAAMTQVKRILPKKSGPLDIGDVLRLIAFPITSPRMAAFFSRLGGKLGTVSAKLSVPGTRLGASLGAQIPRTLKQSNQSLRQFPE